MRDISAEPTETKASIGAAALPTAERVRSSQDERSVPHPVRIRSTVSWYGKLLIVGALLLALGWELLRLLIVLLTLD
jgi:hypothetical protein